VRALQAVWAAALTMSRVVIGVLFAGVLGACSESTSPPDKSPVTEPRIPSQLIAASPTQFVGVVGTTITPAPAVRVLDVNDDPVPGVPVSFGGAPEKVVLTGPDGIASFGSWPLDTLAREQFMGARLRISTQAELVVSFYARAIAGPAARFIAIAGNNQVGRAGKTLPDQLHVKVADVYNNPIRGLIVSFSVVSGGGGIEQQSDTTDYGGLATAGRWSLGPASSQQVMAKAGNLEATFVATLCDTEQSCDPVPRNLAYERDGSVWVNGSDGPVLVTRDASRPSWSPDGSRIAFFKLNANRNEEAICISSEPFSAVNCTPVDLLSQEAVPGMRVSWSPDGGTLALSRVYYGAGNSQLLFLDVATMTLRRHGTIDGGIWSTSWSPDGKAMVVGSESKVYLANASGSDLQVLLPYPVWELAWAPDGRKIGVITLLCPWDCYGAEIALLDLTTKALNTVERVQGGSFDGLTWSPDGNSLAYSAWVPETTITQVRVRSMVDGTSRTVLSNASNPSWRP
jgi:Tol biopolymer transport system component